MLVPRVIFWWIEKCGSFGFGRHKVVNFLGVDNVANAREGKLYLFYAAEGIIMMTCGLNHSLPLSGTSRGIALGEAMVDASVRMPVIKLKLSHVRMLKPFHSCTKFDFD